MGSDFGDEILVLDLIMFQSTPPHGERLSKKMQHIGAYTFQSTPPHGERRIEHKTKIRYIKFQSTPPHGERPLKAYIKRSIRSVSIHAPTWGATSATVKTINSTLVSIHAPTWGATLNHNWNQFALKFQSTPPHGERLFEYKSLEINKQVLNTREPSRILHLECLKINLNLRKGLIFNALHSARLFGVMHVHL